MDYASPEIMKRNSYNNTIDIWGLGCVLYTLVTRRMAFRGRISENRTTPGSRVLAYAPKSVHKVIQWLCIENGFERPTAAIVVKDLTEYIEKLKLQK